MGRHKDQPRLVIIVYRNIKHYKKEKLNYNQEEPTSLANLRSKSVSMAIASSAASIVPKAGINLVLLEPGVGYLETVYTVLRTSCLRDNRDMCTRGYGGHQVW